MSLGLIAGTVFYGLDLFREARKETIQTEFGPAMILRTDRVVYIPRHGLDDKRYLLPHRINHPANMAALKSVGVHKVIGVNSSGSLQGSLPPGTITVPEDYIALNDPATAASGPLHITPGLSEPLRRALIEAGRRAGVPVRPGGVYWQSRGPRLETKAEIRFICNFADVIGMTLGSEATTAAELGLEYASLCSVDNYAHGLAKPPLSEEEIRQGARANSENMMKIFTELLTEASGEVM